MADINIPPEELGRQAVHSLRGYIYQIFQSVSAWLSVKEHEILLLETADDFAIHADGILNPTQVKHLSSGTITLRSKEVLKSITAFWNFQSANFDRTVTLTHNCVGLLTAPFGAPPLALFRGGDSPRPSGEGKRNNDAPASLNTGRRSHAYLRPHPEEARSAVSKDGQRPRGLHGSRRACGAPHHEERGGKGGEGKNPAKPRLFASSGDLTGAAAALI